jgi:glutaredoxin-like protein NrdH
MIVTVFEKPNCIQCTQSKKLLDKLEIDYKTIDITVDTEAYEYIVNNLGYKQAPVITVESEDHLDGLSWSGFMPELIKGLKND